MGFSETYFFSLVRFLIVCTVGDVRAVDTKGQNSEASFFFASKQ